MGKHPLESTYSFSPIIDPNYLSTLYKFTYLLSISSPNIYQPIDQLYNTLRQILLEFLESPEKLSIIWLNRSIPLIYVLLCQLDEAVVLLRLETIADEYVEFFGR